MDNYEAVGICEGFIECDDESKTIEAWQYLIDTGMAWTLQGWFGRTARHLIDEGICTEQKGLTMKLKDIFRIQEVLDERKTAYDMIEFLEDKRYSQSKETKTKYGDMDITHFIRVFMKNQDGIKKERLEELQYSVNQMLEDIRELKDDEQ